MNQREHIQQLKREIRRLKKLVFHDELTHVLNRRGFLEQATTLFKTLYRPRRDHTTDHDDIPFSVIFLDLDNFKSINDTFGHEAGDEVLKTATKAIKKSVRTNDVIGRFGGEEFVVTLTGADLRVATRVAERIRKNIEIAKISSPNGKHLSVTASIGIATRSAETNLRELIAAADQAMYRAKENGKNQVMVHSVSAPTSNSSMTV